MLFPFEEYRFASKLLKRQQQLQAALFRAEASHLPEGITEVYRRALTAHEAVQKQIERAPRAVVGALAGAAFSLKGLSMCNLLAAALTMLVPLAALAATPQTAVLEVQNMTCGLCP